MYRTTLLTFLLSGSLILPNSLLAETSPTPPTPQLTKADKPLVDLGSEATGGTPNTSKSNMVKRPTQPTTAKTSNTTPQEMNHSSAEMAHSEADHQSTKTQEQGEHHAIWGYAGKEGPKHWGDLSPENIQCKIGKNQSPIDLRDNHALGSVGLPELQIYYKDVPLKVINNGHTLQVNYPLGSYIKLGEKRYELMQFHFHTPSEHMKEGFNYPMEVHLVHRDGDGNYAVIGVIFQEGEENPELETLLRNVPKEINKQEIRRGASLNPMMFIPGNTKFYKYSGSLTTPPCSEGVYWMVFKTPIEASAEQIQMMNEIMGDNARPIQDHNARSLLKSWFENLSEPPMYEYY